MIKVKSTLLQRDYEFSDLDLEEVAQDIASKLIKAVEGSRQAGDPPVKYKAVVKLTSEDETTAQIIRERRGFDLLELFPVLYSRKRG